MNTGLVCVETACRDSFTYAKAGVILDNLRGQRDAPACLHAAPRQRSELSPRPPGRGSSSRRSRTFTVSYGNPPSTKRCRWTYRPRLAAALGVAWLAVVPAPAARDRRQGRRARGL
jgi:hypothetical protein